MHIQSLQFHPVTSSGGQNEGARRRSPRRSPFPRWVLGVTGAALISTAILPSVGSSAGLKRVREAVWHSGAALPSAAMTLDSVSSLERMISAGRAQAERARPEREKGGRYSGGPDEDEQGGLELLESWLYEIQQRAYPRDRVDWTAYERAQKHLSVMPPAHAAQGRCWKFFGPTNFPVPYRIYFGQGAINGRANAIAYDPAQEGVYYLASAGGGIWKTEDRGLTWKPLTDRWPTLQTSSLAVTPDGSTVYAGTGDFAHPRQRYSLGLMRSQDGGATWEHLGPDEMSHFAVSRVLLDPDDPSIITVSTGRGRDVWGKVWQSTDGGQSWTAVLEKPEAWCDVQIGARLPSGGRLYYAVGYGEGGIRRIYRSNDRGRSWAQVFESAPVVRPGLAAMAVSPTDPEKVYVILGALRNVLSSDNGGQSWKDITGNIPDEYNGYNWSQDWYDIWLNCSTRTGADGKPQDVLYAGLIDVVQSLEPGKWRSIGLTYTPQSLTHNDQQGSAVNPRDPNQLLVASDGGAYRMRFNPKSDTWKWESLNARLGITQFYHSAFHPTNPNIVVAGTQDNSTPSCQGNLEHWINVGGGDGAYCAINPRRTSIQYASSQFLHIYRTPDSWETTEDITPQAGDDRRAFIAPFTLDPNNPDLLYAGTNYLWRWNDKTQRWTARLGGQPLSATGAILSITVAKGDADRIYVGSNMGELWMTRDGGKTWTSIRDGRTPLPARAITSIVVDPTNPDQVYVGLSGTGSGHLFSCSNTSAGPDREWRDCSGMGDAALPDVPLNTIALDPEAPTRTIYVGTDLGVFYSSDRGDTWQNATEPLGLPNVQVDDLELVPGTSMLNAATFGRGLWRIQLPSEAKSIPTLSDKQETSAPGALWGILLATTLTLLFIGLARRRTVAARRPVV